MSGRREAHGAFTLPFEDCRRMAIRANWDPLAAFEFLDREVCSVESKVILSTIQLRLYFGAKEPTYPWVGTYKLSFDGCSSSIWRGANVFEYRTVLLADWGSIEYNGSLAERIASGMIRVCALMNALVTRSLWMSALGEVHHLAASQKRYLLYMALG
jgi:hypothetical protein